VLPDVRSMLLPSVSPLQLPLHISTVHTAHIKESYELPVPDGGVSHSVFDTLALVDQRRIGCRYAMIFQLLQPFTMVLHASMHRVCARSKITLTPQLWYIGLLFESFRPLARPTTCPELTFDASLEVIGLLVHE